MDYRSNRQPETPLSVSLGQLYPSPRNAILLDVGCGGGGQLRYFPNAIGLDISLHNLRACLSIGAPLCCADIEVELPFETGSIEVVLISHVLEHVSSPLHLTREAFRVLRAGGRVIIGLPLEMSLFRQVARDHYFTKHPGHIYGFTPDGLRTVVRMAGFNVERVLFDVPLARHDRSLTLQAIVNRVIPPYILKWICPNIWIVGVKPPTMA